MQKSFILILIAFVVATGGYFFWQQQKSTPATPSIQTTVQPSPTSDETTDWKTYTNTDAKISIQHPIDWTATDEGYPSEFAEAKRITLEGKEGEVILDWGSGFGGACPQGYEQLKLYSETIDVCRNVNNDGTEKWSLSIGKAYNISYSGFATANKPYTSNREVILKILSTLQFTDSQTSQIFSTQGQSCGKNAGAGGDAQCASGLVCYYKNAQEEKDGIGTCVKK